MTAYEQDPDVVQWGLQLFDGDPYTYSNYGGCSTISQNDMNYYQEKCYKEDNYDRDGSDTENDELLARALEESLSELAVTEEPSSLLQVADNSKMCIYPPEWHGQAMINYGQESGIEEIEGIGLSSACSSPGEMPYCGDEWGYSLELTDEYAIDGEVGKRLNQMVPVPHVPRINGEIPSLDEATLDHQRLLERLQVYQLIELKVHGDGNCQFRALSDQFYRSTEHHKFVREEVVNQLKSHPKIYEGYVPMAYNDYLDKMSKNGEWGDHVTLQAAADSYGVKFFVITSFKDTCYIEIIPNVQRSNRVICLSLWAEVHYNSIYFEGDVPVFETKKNKKRWASRNKHSESTKEHH